MEQIKGVNLGNWLVLEKWMSSELFYNLPEDVEDEMAFYEELSQEEAENRLFMHRSYYIQERDFQHIKKLGLNLVRIPVPYFIFGDCGQGVGCIEFLDKAFDWAEKYDLKILIDLHTAPDSQNGFDNGGISGVCKWSQEPDEVEFELTVLERLAERYGTRKGLWGIEILNEPVLEDMWESMKVAERYPAVDPEKAKGTKPNTMEFVRGFYLEAYDRIRRHMPEDKYVVFHDAFRLKAWKDFMREDKYKNVVLDTHQYLMVAEMNGCEQTVEEYVKYVKELKKDIAEMQEYFPVICGEWCLFNSLAVGCDTKGGQTVLNGVEGMAQETVSAEEKKKIYNAVAEAQLDAWNAGSGYFYWSYKLLTDTVNTPGWVGWDSWDFGRCADFGWFPTEK